MFLKVKTRKEVMTLRLWRLKLKKDGTLPSLRLADQSLLNKTKLDKKVNTIEYNNKQQHLINDLFFN